MDHQRGAADAQPVVGAPARLVLAGLGAIGLQAHLPAMLRNPAVQIVGLVDPDSERRAAALLVLGPGADTVELGTSVESLTGPADGYVLATPPWVTSGLAARLAADGYPVLAEKPVAVNSEAAAVLTALAPAARRRIQVGLTYRHDPALQQVKDLLQENLLGGPLLVRAHIYDEARNDSDAAHAERIRGALAHGTPVVHEGAHVFDWLSFLLGGPASVRDAWSLRTDPDLAADNLTGGRLHYPDGSIALVEFGWFTQRLPRCELSFLGPSGELTIDAQTFDGTVRTAAGERRITAPGSRNDRSFDRQLDRFLDLLTGRIDNPTPDLWDGLQALRTAEELAALAATRTDGAIG